MAAARAVALLGRADEVLPVLVKELRNKDNEVVRHYAALALENIGENARPAIPALQQATKDKYDFVHRVATRIVETLNGST